MRQKSGPEKQPAEDAIMDILSASHDAYEVGLRPASEGDPVEEGAVRKRERQETQTSRCGHGRDHRLSARVAPSAVDKSAPASAPDEEGTPPMSRRDGGIDVADRLLPPQAAGMSCYSADEEITSICADFLVELRGFKPRCARGCLAAREPEPPAAGPGLPAP